MQMGLSESAYVRKEKVTRQQRFLQEMDQVVPWAELEKCVSPYYDKTGVKGGRPPVRLGIMLRIHFLQQWFSLSDPGMEEKLYEVSSICAFAGINRSLMDVPDETTILNFRHLLEKHQLAQVLFDCVNDILSARGLLLKQGTLVDATLIDAAGSTKNQDGRRDPEMHSTKKGATMLATLQRLGIVPSFSRPSVSDDNPYSDSLFRTTKYCPMYPRKPFASLEEARTWTLQFTAWYNNEHRHSGIRFVTPAQRHTQTDTALLNQRSVVYEAANPLRWRNRTVRNWTSITSVWLNPPKEHQPPSEMKLAA